MAKWRNPLDGTAGTAVTATNGGGDPESAVIGGAMSYTNVAAFSGTTCAVADTDSVGYVYREVTGRAQRRVKGVAYYRFNAPLSNGADVQALMMYTPGNPTSVACARMRITGLNTATPRVHLDTRGSGSYVTRWSSTSYLSPNVWYRFELDVDAGTDEVSGRAHAAVYIEDFQVPSTGLDSGRFDGINTAGTEGAVRDCRAGTVAGLLLDHRGVADQDDAIDGPWTQATPPDAPSVTPGAQTVDWSVGGSIDWVHNSTDGAAQSAYEVNYSTDGGATWSTTNKQSSPTTTRFTIGAGAYPAGTTVTLRVRTWGASTTDSGAWSPNVTMTFAEENPSPVVAPCFKRYGESTSGTNNDLLKCGAAVGDLVILSGFHDVYTSPPSFTDWPTPGWTTVVDLPVVGSRQAWAMWKVVDSSDLAVAWTWPNGLTNHGTAATTVVYGGTGVEPGAFWTRASGTPTRPDDYTNIAPGFSYAAGAAGRLLALSFEATSATETAGPTVSSGELIGSSWDTNATSIEQVQVVDLGAVPEASAGSSSAVSVRYQNAQANNGAAIQLLVRLGENPEPPATAVTVTRVGSGGTRSTGYLYVQKDAPPAPPSPVTQVRQVRGKGVDGVSVYDVPTMNDALLGGGKPRVAHRGGGADHPEMSLFAYTMACTRGFPALEISLARTSDGVWFGCHDQTLARVTGGASTADPSTMTWAQVQQYQIVSAITSDPSQPDRPFCRIEDLLDAYGQTHVIFVDPKYALSRTAELLDLLETWYMGHGNVTAQQHVVFKYYGIEDGNGAVTAKNRGYTTWGYFYSADLPQLPTYADRWTWLGFSYDGSQANWDTVLAYSKPVLAHIPVTEAQVQQGFSAGASGAMVSGTEQAFLVPVTNAEGTGPSTEFVLGETKPTRDNVGVTMGGYAAPTVVQGNGSQSILYIESGQVVENRIIRSWVRIRPGGILRRCIIAGPDDMSAAAIPMVFSIGGTWNGSNPAVIENCTFAPGMYAPAALRGGFASCIGGNRFVARYCVATGARDGFQSNPATAGDATSVRLEGNWVGELMHLVPDDYTGKPDTHNDCYQEYGSQNPSLPDGAVTMLGCTFEAVRHPSADPLVAPDRQSLAGVMLSKSAGNYSNIVVDRCWFHGGVQQVNAVPATPSGTMKLSVTGSRFERGTADGGSPVADQDGIVMPFVAAYVGNYVTLTWSDNVWVDGGVATPVRAN